MSRVALVTGSSSGIGLALAETFYRANWKLSLLDQTPGPLSRGPSVLELVGDVADEHIRAAFVRDSVATFGRVDVLVNSAGIGLYRPASNTDRHRLERLFEVNVHAPWQLTRSVLPYMIRQQAGTIVNLGSVAAAVALPWAAAYSASKASFQCLTGALRRELSATGVKVIDARLGIVDTPFRANVLDGQPPEAVARIRSIISPGEVARRIFQSVERGYAGVIYVPRLARLFCLMDALSPALMDWYLRRYFPEPGKFELGSQRDGGA